MLAPATLHICFSHVVPQPSTSPRPSGLKSLSRAGRLQARPSCPRHTARRPSSCRKSTAFLPLLSTSPVCPAARQAKLRPGPDAVVLRDRERPAKRVPCKARPGGVRRVAASGTGRTLCPRALILSIARSVALHVASARPYRRHSGNHLEIFPWGP